MDFSKDVQEVSPGKHTDRDINPIFPRCTFKDADKTRTEMSPLPGTNLISRISNPSLANHIALTNPSFAGYLLSLDHEYAPKAENQFAWAQLPDAISKLVKVHQANKARYEGNGMRQFPMYSMAELNKGMKVLEYNGSVIRAPRNVASAILKHVPAITSSSP